MCVAAYGFLSAYAVKAWHREQLSVHQVRLGVLKQRQQELVRKTAMLKRASQFTDRVRALKLEPDAWAFYDVNVQSPLDFDAAQQMVYLCGDSSVAYYWPISLEINKQGAQGQSAGVPTANQNAPVDVQLSIKGRFAARR